MTFSRISISIAGMAALACFASACGGPGSDEQTAPTSARSASNKAAIAEVEQLASGKLDFPKPDVPVDPGTHNVAIIAGGLASEGPAGVVKATQAAIKKIGWTTGEPGDGKFSPTTQASLIEKAVLDGVDGLVLVLIDPESVASALKAAANAKIPIVCALCAPELPNGIVSISYNAEASGKAQAAYAASVADDKSTIVVYQNSEFAYTTIQAKAAAAHAKELCPGCTVETPSLLLAESNMANAPVFTQLLSKYPQGKLASVVMPFDTPAGVLSNSATKLGRSDISVIGVGGLAPFIDMVGTNTPPVAAADIVYAIPFYGWALVDQLARLFAGEPNWDSSSLPVAIVNKDNYGDYEPGNVFAAPTWDYEAEFATLWGK